MKRKHKALLQAALLAALQVAASCLFFGCSAPERELAEISVDLGRDGTRILRAGETEDPEYIRLRVLEGDRDGNDSLPQGPQSLW